MGEIIENNGRRPAEDHSKAFLILKLIYLYFSSETTSIPKSRKDVSG